jgi:hypothetical protein
MSPRSTAKYRWSEGHLNTSELEAEGRRLVALGGEKRLTLRLLGGIGVRATCPSFLAPPFDRACGDLDFAARGSAAAVERTFLAAGWVPEREFNLYNGGERLIFRRGELKADLFLGDFRMCHRIALNGRLDADPLALPLAELLLTKLQVVEANDKDLADATCILLDHEPGLGDGPRIDREAFAGHCASDWGLWRTATASLDKTASWAESHVQDRANLAIILSHRSELAELLRSSRKSLSWKARSVLGESMRWYELPEEVDR